MIKHRYYRNTAERIDSEFKTKTKSIVQLNLEMGFQQTTITQPKKKYLQMLNLICLIKCVINFLYPQNESKVNALDILMI